MDATLTRVDYDLRLDGAVATGQATLTVDVLKDGWVRVPVPAGLLVSGARGTRTARFPLYRPPLEAAPSLLCSLDAAGQPSCWMWPCQAESTSAGQRVAVPGGGSGITRASLTATEDMEVTVAGGVVTRCFGRELGSRTGSVKKALRSPVAESGSNSRERSSRCVLRGSLAQLFGLGEDSTSLNAEVELEVVQGAAKQARLAVPEGVAINHVPRRNGGGVGSKERRAGGELPRTGRGRRSASGSSAKRGCRAKEPSMCRCSACSTSSGKPARRRSK